MRNTLLRLTLALFVVAAASVAPSSSIAQNSNKKAAQERTLTGFISDNHCGLKHMTGMGDDKSCTLMCVKNGKFVLADRDNKRVYQLDKMGQEKAREFAGQKVKVTGRVSGRTIRVTSIQAA
ncbi:MAG TPA: DUF5818 domain-containing protein [Pyrinomonadaceae bacterium]|nr:DUF5818 domain-containing protein [Pyrinomonadaceae bacterium]